MQGENVIHKVAKALGVEIGEVFPVCNSSDETVEYYRLTIDGAEHFCPSTKGFHTVNGIKGDFYHADYILEPIIIGRRAWIRRKVEQGALF